LDFPDQSLVRRPGESQQIVACPVAIPVAKQRREKAERTAAWCERQRLPPQPLSDSNVGLLRVAGYAKRKAALVLYGARRIGTHSRGVMG
jgi:hypothetical protein